MTKKTENIRREINRDGITRSNYEQHRTYTKSYEYKREKSGILETLPRTKPNLNEKLRILPTIPEKPRRTSNDATRYFFNNFNTFFRS